MVRRPAAIHDRKAEHLDLCANGEVGFRSLSTLFEDVRLVHDALPELAETDIDTSVMLFGKKLAGPIVIAAMTGGTDEALRVNRSLARIAEERGLAFGLGSQRAMHVKPARASSYQVRRFAPRTVLLGNIGLVQARAMKTREVRNLVDAIGADALCVHLNPAMELIQPGGDRDFRGGLETLARLRADLGVPVVAKETGCGLSLHVAERLHALGIEHVDVSAAGGTSWVGVETMRAERAGDLQGKALGEAFWDWGIPTAASVVFCARQGFRTVVATGGVASGLDVAKAISLGATLGGMARPLLRALIQEGERGVHATLDAIFRELRAAMLLTGSPSLAHLRRAPRVLSHALQAWIQ